MTQIQEVNMTEFYIHKSWSKVALRMSAIIAAVALLFVISTVQSNATSLSIPEPPDVSTGIIDETGTLTSSELKEISESINNKKSQINYSQILVLLTNELPADKTVDEAALEVARKWGIESSNSENGVLIYITKNDRKLKVEVADEVSSYLDKSETEKVVRDYLVPKLSEDNHYQGIKDGVTAIRTEINGEPDTSHFPIPKTKKQKRKEAAAANATDDDGTHLPFGLIVLIVIIIGTFIRGGTRSTKSNRVSSSFGSNRNRFGSNRNRFGSSRNNNYSHDSSPDSNYESPENKPPEY